MKKIIALCLTFILVFSLSSCRKPEADETVASNIAVSDVQETVQPEQTESDKKYNEEYFKPGEIESTLSSEVAGTSSKSPAFREEVLALKYDGHFYKNSSIAARKIYKKIDSAVFNMTDGYIDLGECEYSDILLGIKAVLSDRPEYFWMSNHYVLKVENNNYKISFNSDGAKYLVTKSERRTMQTALSSAFLEVEALANSVATDYEKALVVHDWLMDRAEYDQKAQNNNSKNAPLSTQLSFTSYGGMVRREGSLNSLAVCEGYAKAYQYILNRLGLECITVGGTVDGVGHMWNMAKVGGEWYNIDVTQNDTDNLFLHSFFLASDNMIKSTHIPDKDFYQAKISTLEKGRFNLFKPEAKTNKQNYFTVNKTEIASITEAEEKIEKYIENNFSLGEAEFYIKKGFLYNANTCLDLIDADLIISNIESKLNEKIALKVIGHKGSKSLKLFWAKAI